MKEQRERNKEGGTEIGRRQRGRKSEEGERKKERGREEGVEKNINFILSMYFKVINVFIINIYITGCQCQMVSILQLLSDHMWCSVSLNFTLNQSCCW